MYRSGLSVAGSREAQNENRDAWRKPPEKRKGATRRRVCRRVRGETRGIPSGFAPHPNLRVRFPAWYIRKLETLAANARRRSLHHPHNRENQTMAGLWKSLCFESLENRRVLAAAVLQNPIDCLDVNQDGQRTLQDGLAMVRFLTDNGSMPVNQVAPSGPDDRCQRRQHRRHAGHPGLGVSHGGRRTA